MNTFLKNSENGHCKQHGSRSGPAKRDTDLKKSFFTTFTNLFFSVIGLDYLATYVLFVNISMFHKLLCHKSCIWSGIFCIPNYVFFSIASFRSCLSSISYCCVDNVILHKAAQWYIMNTAHIKKTFLLSILGRHRINLKIWYLDAIATRGLTLGCEILTKR